MALHIAGTTDEQTTCDLCGKVNLSITVIVADDDGNETGRYGTSCVSTIIGSKVTAKQARKVDAMRRHNLSLAWSHFRNAIRTGDNGALALACSDVRQYTFGKTEEEVKAMFFKVRDKVRSAKS